MENMLSKVTSMGSEELLAHTAWMNRLATRLVLGADRVDDLVQETWQAVLINPPSKHVPMGAWLAGTMRKRALETRRSDGRRVGREARVAEETSNQVPSTTELIARLEQQRLLLAQVNGLPAKYREVLLLRFFEDMQPAAIAKHLELPVSTVKTQLQRALDQMRERLDTEHNGDRQAWSLAFLPLATLDRTSVGLISTLISTPIGVMIMTHLINTSVFAALVLLGALGVWKLTAQPVSKQTEGPALDLASGNLATTNRPNPDVDSAIQSPVRQATPVPSATIHGKVVDMDGKPVLGSQINQVRAPNHDGGSTPNWSRRRLAEVGPTGNFRIARADFEENDGSNGPPWLTASHPNFVSIDPLQLHDGEITLLLTPILSTTVEVEVIDKTSGSAVPRFHAFASLQNQPVSYSRKLRDTSAETLTGYGSLPTNFPKGQRLLVEVDVLGLPDEPGLSQGRSRHHQVKPSKLVEPVPGGITKVQFILELDQPERAPGASIAFGRIVDDESGLPISGAEIRVDPLEEQTLDQQGRSLNRYGSQFRQVFSQPDGNFRIAVHNGVSKAVITAYHPLYQQPSPSSWTFANSAQFDGTNPVEIRLKKRATLRGQVIDSIGAPLPLMPLLCIGNDEHAPQIETFELRTTQHWRPFTDDQGRFEIPGLEANRYTVLVLPSPGAADEMALANARYDLAAGEVREVTLQVDNPNRVAVTGIVNPPYQLDYALAPVFLPYEIVGALVLGRPSGSGFEATDLAAGKYLVILAPAIDDHEGPYALVRDVAISPGATRTLNFDFPTGSLTGKIDFPDQTGTLRVVAVPTVPAGFAHDFIWGPKGLRLCSSPVAEDGTYRLEHLESGSYQLVVFPNVRTSSVKIVAQQPITINGHTRLGTWHIE